jgi:hypothetical protein
MLRALVTKLPRPIKQQNVAQCTPCKKYCAHIRNSSSLYCRFCTACFPWSVQAAPRIRGGGWSIFLPWDQTALFVFQLHYAMIMAPSDIEHAAASGKPWPARKRNIKWDIRKLETRYRVSKSVYPDIVPDIWCDFQDPRYRASASCPGKQYVVMVVMVEIRIKSYFEVMTFRCNEE